MSKRLSTLAALTVWFGLAGTLRGAEFFVAPTGDDAHPGTLEQPFATVQRGQKAAGPGDTVYIRGGTYRMREDQIARTEQIWAYVTFLDKSGEPDKRINYFAYKDEQPVFDFSAVKPAGRRITAFYIPASWVHVRGLEVVGVQVTIKGHTQSICFDNEGSHNVLERLSMHDGQAIGIYAVRGSDNLFLNCDAYRNHDPVSGDGKGGNVDGFGCHPPKGSTGNVFRGCRAWFNSDDGFDCITAHEAVTFENCWAFYNGYGPDFARLADGNGFKAGGYGSTPADRLPSLIPRHVVRFCLAARNKNSGFYANHHPGGCDWFNNSAWRNGANYNMLNRLADNRTDIDGFGHALKNNVGFEGRAELVRIDTAKCDLSHNAFGAAAGLTERDFASLDESQLVRPRQPNGDLPAIDFMRPAEQSALVDKGTNIGFPFRGEKPDLGAFER